MDIIVCYKITPCDQSIAINSDRTLSFANSEYSVGQYDLNAVEAGAKLVEAHGGTVTALTVGTEEVENSKLRKSVLCRGPHSCCTVNDPKLKGADSWTVAATLAEAVKVLGAYDLILCGEGSSDLYSQQVGILLGEMLGIPTLNAVSDIVVDGESLTVRRSLEDEVETLSVTLPAVLSVTSDINVTRVPSMRDILAAGKKPVKSLTGAEVKIPETSPIETLSVLAPAQSARKCVITEGDSPENISDFFKTIAAEIN